MAEVSYVAPLPSRHVVGDLVVKFFAVSGASGSTLHTGMSSLVYVNRQAFTQAGTASLITGIAVAGGLLTFTSSNPMVTEVIEVIGREG